IFIYYGINESEQCLCPPSYYGDRCQYQNQRVSLTLRFRNENIDKLAIFGIVITLVDSTGFIHSHEQLTYIPIHACNNKFNIYLLNRDRPKDVTKKYTVYIDAYDKINLAYLTSWTLPVTFLFMPVNHLRAQLITPERQDCHISCDTRYPEQHIKHKCTCSRDSLCVATVNNRSICLCSLAKRSPRCLISSICHKNSCMNDDGLCVPHDAQVSFFDFISVCQDGFSGSRCENKDVRIDILFSDVSTPQAILLHFITIQNYDATVLNPIPI
ncbi:unnamed protein product, partial [Rotaria magnacalcarata]